MPQAHAPVFHRWLCYCSPYLFLFISADGLAAFRAFLKSEFSEENIEFWLACEDFKKTKSSVKIASKAQKIYSEFIGADAPKEVTQLFINVLGICGGGRSKDLH